MEIKSQRGFIPIIIGFLAFFTVIVLVTGTVLVRQKKSVSKTLKFTDLLNDKFKRLPTPVLTKSQRPILENNFLNECQKAYQSEACTNEFNQLVKKNCNFDINLRKPTVRVCVGDKCKEGSNNPAANNPEVAKVIACADNYYRQLGQIACGQDSSSIDCQCSKDSQPLSCLLNKLVDIEAGKISKSLSNLHLTILCPMKEAFEQTLGFGPFKKIDCRGDYPGKQSTDSQDPQAKCQQLGRYYPECDNDYENNCSYGIYSIGCQTYCDNQARAGSLSGTCVQYFKAFCVTVDRSAEGCRTLIQQEYPNAADFCYRFPQARVCQELGL